MNTATLEKVSFDFPVEVLKQVEENGEFHIVGYAATTDFDLQGDIITEDALKEAAGDLLKNSTVLLNHDIKQPIGRVTKAQFDKNGLLIDALISKTEADIIQKIKEGILNKFSIRGEVLERESKFIPSLDRVANVIRKMTLIEVSLVSVPANPEARAIGWYISKALAAVQPIPAATSAQPHSQGGKPMSDENPNAATPPETPPETPDPGSATPEGTPPAAAAAPESRGADAPEPATPAPDPAAIQKSVTAAILKEVDPVFLKKAELETAIAAQAHKAITDEARKMVAEEVQKSLNEQINKVVAEEVQKAVMAEVQKQLESSLKAIPALRKGLITPDPEQEDAKKTFESLPPEKKLRVALALQQA